MKTQMPGGSLDLPPGGEVKMYKSGQVRPETLRYRHDSTVSTHLILLSRMRRILYPLYSYHSALL
jgi:hypothetical protein